MSLFWNQINQPLNFFISKSKLPHFFSEDSLNSGAHTFLRLFRRSLTAVSVRIPNLLTLVTCSFRVKYSWRVPRSRSWCSFQAASVISINFLMLSPDHWSSILAKSFSYAKSGFPQLNYSFDASTPGSRYALTISKFGKSSGKIQCFRSCRCFRKYSRSIYSWERTSWRASSSD